MKLLFYSSLVLAAGLGAPAAHAGFDVMGSTTGQAMMLDLEVIGGPATPSEAMTMNTAFFDRSLSGRSLDLSAVRVTAAPQAFRGPGYQFPGQGYGNQYPRYSPPPPRSPYQAYNPYNPYSPYDPYYPPVRREPTWGDKFVNFLNDVEATVNNVRQGIADAIGPKYPYITRYIDPPYGGERIPVYRNRSRTFDVPGYYLPAGYGRYSGYYPGGGDRAPLGGVTRYVGGYGWVPPFGRNPDVRYVPNVGLVPGRDYPPSRGS